MYTRTVYTTCDSLFSRENIENGMVQKKKRCKIGLLLDMRGMVKWRAEDLDRVSLCSNQEFYQ